MGKLAAELLLIAMVCAGVIIAIWKLVISKIPAVRVFLKKQAVNETSILADAASTVDMAKAKDHKEIVETFTKEKF